MVMKCEHFEKIGYDEKKKKKKPPPAHNRGHYCNFSINPYRYINIGTGKFDEFFLSRSIYMMIIPRLYNKRHKNGIRLMFVASCLLLALHWVFSDSVEQYMLENEALVMNKESSFSPRSTTFAVFSHINTYNDQDLRDSSESQIASDKGAIYFHWDDWVDLYPAKHILERYRKEHPEGQCDKVLNNFASVNGYFMESYNKKVYRGMSNLYCMKDIPSKIIASTDDTLIEVPVLEKKRIGETKMPANITKSQLVQEMVKAQDTEYQKFTVKKLKPPQKTVDVKAEDFVFNPDLEIFKLKEKLHANQIKSSELKYLEFLEYSNQLVEKSDRYFKYPWIISDVAQGHSHHLAYPFFKRFIGDREKQSVIHHMIRAWFQFTEATDMPSWINYGSLLGWAHNGINMPWDTDVDVQMPIAHLDKLGRLYNRSLILENPRYGNSKYFLEIAPTYIRQGNGKNFIDARFIDINSGLYIDISALSHSSFAPPDDLFVGIPEDKKQETLLVHCKNWNWHTLDEILPIRHTYFEGGDVYIPNNVSRILSRKYGKDSFTTKIHVANHNYQKDIKMWVPDRICESLPNVNRYDNNDKSKLTFEGACNEIFLQDEYQINYECTKRHAELELNVDRNIDYNIEETGNLPIFRKDAWDYYEDINERVVDHDRWYTREEVV